MELSIGNSPATGAGSDSILSLPAWPEPLRVLSLPASLGYIQHDICGYQAKRPILNIEFLSVLVSSVCRGAPFMGLLPFSHWPQVLVRSNIDVTPYLGRILPGRLLHPIP